MTFVENMGALLFTPVSLVFSAKTDDRLSPGQSNLSYPIPEYPAADIAGSLAMIMLQLWEERVIYWLTIQGGQANHVEGGMGTGRKGI